MTRDYESGAIRCEYLSDATPAECERVIGKTVASVNAREYAFEIIFTDGTTLETRGARGDDCALGVEVTEPDTAVTT